MQTKLYFNIRNSYCYNFPNFILFGILVCISIIFSIYSFSLLIEGHNWGDDFGLYLHLAHNIIEWRPYDYHRFGISVPPGFPLILAGWIKLFGNTYVSLKTINIVCWIISGWSTTLIARHFFGNISALLIAVTFFLIPSYYFMQQNIITDIPFVAVSSTLLLLAQRYGEYLRMPREQLPIFQAFGIGALLFAAILLRPAGIPLAMGLIGGGAMICLQKPWSHTRVYAFIFLVGIVIVVLTIYYVLFSNSIGGYLTVYERLSPDISGSSIYQLWIMFKTRAHEEMLVTHVLLLSYPVSDTTASIIILYIVIGFCCYIISTGDWILPVFFICYIALIIITPWSGGFRYQLPLVTPILLFSIAPGVLVVRLFFQHKISSITLSFAAVGLLALSFFTMRHMAVKSYENRNYNDNEVNNQTTIEVIAWLKSNSLNDDKICHFKPRAIMYFTDRITCFLPLNVPLNLGNYLSSKDGRFAVINLLPIYTPIAIQERLKNDKTIMEVFRNYDYAVYAQSR
jgi:hypothetical protein